MYCVTKESFSTLRSMVVEKSSHDCFGKRIMTEVPHGLEGAGAVKGCWRTLPTNQAPLVSSAGAGRQRYQVCDRSTCPHNTQ